MTTKFKTQRWEVIIWLLVVGVALGACATEADDTRSPAANPTKSEWRVSYAPPAGSTLGTPWAQSRTPQPTPAPVNLLTTNTAPLWVNLSDGEFYLNVYADPTFAIEEFGLNVLVDGVTYCNTSRIYEDDGPVELGCVAEERSHKSVKRVSAQTYLGDLRCERNIRSIGRTTIFACDWR